MQKQLWTCVWVAALALGCDTLKLTPETTTDPTFERCSGDAGRGDASSDACGDFEAAYCARYPDDSERCSDGGDGEPDAGELDAGDDAAVDEDAAPACSCPEETPVCLDDGGCAACSEDSGTCPDDRPLCTAEGTCIACLDDDGCGDAAAAHCDEAGSCVGCTDDAQCTHLGLVCDEASSTCVACTLDTEEERCPDPDLQDRIAAPACSLTELTCTGRPRGSVSGCEPCASDSECIPGTLCVETNFNGTPNGTFCLQPRPDDVEGCPNGVENELVARSVSGVDGTYCAPRDRFTTCAAILDVGNACTASDECGDEDAADGVCASGKCTYPCLNNTDCDRGFCVGPTNMKSCVF